MRTVYHRRYGELSLPEHVFPIEKYRLTLDRLLADGTVHPDTLLEPQPLDWVTLGRAHAGPYLEDLRHGRLTERTARSELPVDRELIGDFILMAGGTLAACRAALEDGAAVHLGGGFHHAMPGHAEGFCYVNDLACAVLALMDEGLVRRPAVVDCDLHQGNGTAVIFAGDDRVFTFSIHEGGIYPIPKERSSLDVSLPAGTGDAEYLERLSGAIEAVFVEHQPDFVLYQAGADPYEEDVLGGLRLSRAGLRARDRLVLGRAAREAVPFAVTLGGGYATRLADTVAIHADTARVAAGLAPRGGGGRWVGSGGAAGARSG